MVEKEEPNQMKGYDYFITYKRQGFLIQMLSLCTTVQLLRQKRVTSRKFRHLKKDAYE